MSASSQSRTPLWSRLAQTLASDIISGRQPVGSTLPTEAELMEIHAMSRHTIRSALAELVSLGLVERTPHIGTRVISDGCNADFAAIWAPHDVKTARALLDIRRLICDESVSARTGFAVQTPLITLSFLLKSSANRPLSHIRLWIRDAARDLTPYLTTETAVPVLELIERHADVRCSSIRQSVSVNVLDVSLAKSLKSSAGAPSLLMTRTYLDRRSSPLIVSEETFTPGSTSPDIVFKRLEK